MSDAVERRKEIYNSHASQSGTMRALEKQSVADEVALAKYHTEQQLLDPNHLGGRDPNIAAHIEYMLG